MYSASVLRFALLFLVPASILSTLYLYFYPIFHLCAFPSPKENTFSEYLNTVRQHTHFPYLASDTHHIAPFRLLSFGDPQIEGDSSIPHLETTNLPNLKKFWKHVQPINNTISLQNLRYCLHDLIDFYLDDIPKSLGVWRKRLDHLGNDFYLGHIYRAMNWWTSPTHVTVLGDLIGSQWVNDNEFENRGWRYWNRVFRGGIKVEKELMYFDSKEFRDIQRLGRNEVSWARRIINIAGNHDIGYAGDISYARTERFARIFGVPSYELRFQYPVGERNGLVASEKPSVPELRIVVLNDLNLDIPAGSKELQEETYKFLNTIIKTSYDVDRLAHFTLVLTHVPLFKKDGICTDGPFFKYYEGKFENGVKEQNLLSSDASKILLEGIFGKSGNSNAPGKGFGRGGIILNGHDHEGCDVFHYINQSVVDGPKWEATTWQSALSSGIQNQPGIPNLREITVRSMMGAYDGNVGLLSLWFDEESWAWKYEYTNCRLGKQHIWWVVHVLDLITCVILVCYGGSILAEKCSRPQLVLTTKLDHDFQASEKHSHVNTCKHVRKIELNRYNSTE